MNKIIFAGIVMLCMITISAIACDKKGKGNCCEKKGAGCSEKTAKMKGDKAAFSCKLTSKELQQRKAEVIGSLKEQVLERKELSNGYAYKFKSDDQTIDQLVSFIKAEKQCCSFFSFNLAIDEEATWLHLTGEEGVKDFITAELSF